MSGDTLCDHAIHSCMYRPSNRTNSSATPFQKKATHFMFATKLLSCHMCSNSFANLFLFRGRDWTASWLWRSLSDFASALLPTFQLISIFPTTYIRTLLSTTLQRDGYFFALLSLLPVFNQYIYIYRYILARVHQYFSLGKFYGSHDTCIVFCRNIPS